MNRTGSSFALLAAALLFCALPACGNRVSPPAINAEAAAKQALADHDANGDGVLDARELEKCPSLLQAAKALDKDGDRRVSAAEIEARIRSFQQTRIGLMSVGCEVTLDGAPLAGAEVRLVPEKFLGPAVRPARGVTDAQGYVDFTTEGQNLPGVACGFYRVEVSKKDGAGIESLPAKFNAQTVVGYEVSPDLRGNVPLRLRR